MSMKWCVYLVDVLLLWVVEMDVKFLLMVVDVFCRVIDDGDIGYFYGMEYVEVVCEFVC